MSGNSDPVVPWLFRLQDDVTAHLVYAALVPVLAKVPDQFLTAQITR